MTSISFLLFSFHSSLAAFSQKKKDNNDNQNLLFLRLGASFHGWVSLSRFQILNITKMFWKCQNTNTDTLKYRWLLCLAKRLISLTSCCTPSWKKSYTISVSLCLCRQSSSLVPSVSTVLRKETPILLDSFSLLLLYYFSNSSNSSSLLNNNFHWGPHYFFLPCSKLCFHSWLYHWSCDTHPAVQNKKNKEHGSSCRVKMLLLHSSFSTPSNSPTCYRGVP